MGPNAFPFWSKQSKRGNLKYWHFASTTCRQCLQLAGRVYLWCTVSTDPRPPTPYMRVNDCSGPFWGKGAFGPLPKYWHFASTTCRQCLQLAGRVHLWCTVSTDPRPPTPYVRVNDGSGPFWGKGAFGPLPKYWHFASTTCRQCLQLVYSVYMCVCVCIYIYAYIHVCTYICRTTLYEASYCVVLCRTVSYSVVQCRTVLYCVVLCRTVSYCVVQCRTVSYCVVLCRTMSYCVVLCRTVSYSVYIHTYIYIYMSYDTVRRVVLCRTRCRTAPTPYDTVRHSTTQYDTVRHSTTQYDTVRHSTTRYDTVRHGTTQYDTVRHSTTQYDTVRHGTSHTDIYICRHINTCKWKKKQIGQNGAKWVQMRFHFGQNSPKGETSNIGTSRLQHADNVYN